MRHAIFNSASKNVHLFVFLKCNHGVIGLPKLEGIHKDLEVQVLVLPRTVPGITPYT